MYKSSLNVYLKQITDSEVKLRANLKYAKEYNKSQFEEKGERPEDRLSVRTPFIIFPFKTSKDYTSLPSFTLGPDHLFHCPSEYRSMARHMNPATQRFK